MKDLNFKAIKISAVKHTKVSINQSQTRNPSFSESKTEEDPIIENLDIPELYKVRVFGLERKSKQSTIDSSPLFIVFDLLNLLEIGNNKPRQRKITSLR